MTDIKERTAAEEKANYLRWNQREEVRKLERQLDKELHTELRLAKQFAAADALYPELDITGGLKENTKHDERVSLLKLFTPLVDALKDASIIDSEAIADLTSNPGELIGVIAGTAFALNNQEVKAAINAVRVSDLGEELAPIKNLAEAVSGVTKLLNKTAPTLSRGL